MMEAHPFSSEIEKILNQTNAPEQLVRHLTIVHAVANSILIRMSAIWPELRIGKALVLFGAGTHDIGKTIHQNELYEPGKKHEKAGQNLLISLGVSEEKARFAFTHGNWQEKNLPLEDLLVSLADKIWKGKRVDELEEKICQSISAKLEIDYWEVYPELDIILNEIAIGADRRIDWQKSY